MVVEAEKPVDEIVANEQSIYESPEVTFVEEKPQEEVVVLDDSITPPDSGELLSNETVEETPAQQVQIEQEHQLQVIVRNSGIVFCL